MTSIDVGGTQNMTGKAETLKGRGRLIGPGFDSDISYELWIVTEAAGAPHMQDRGAAIEGLKTITGRVTLAGSTHAPFGQKLTLILEDGRKLSVLAQGDGRVTGTGGGFFR
jgi:hypothetical protein